MANPTAEEISSSAAAPKKRTRTSKPKVRTGCLTWIRRVKCDEEKPACRRCTSTGRTCDGYDKPAPSRRPPSNNDPSSLRTGSSSSQLLSPASSAAAAGNVRLLPGKKHMGQALRLIRPLLAEIMGSSEERRFFHRYRTGVAVDGMTMHLANKSRFWDEQAPALGHSDEAVKHALIAMGAAYQNFLTGRNEGATQAGDARLEIFTIQQYNKAIAHLQTNTPNRSTAHTEDPKGQHSIVPVIKTTSSPSADDDAAEEENEANVSFVPPPSPTTYPSENPLLKLETILFCCLTFINIECLRRNYRAAIAHLVNGLRIIDSEVPYSILVLLRGPPGMAINPPPPQKPRQNMFGLTGKEIPSEFLLNILFIFTRYELSATLFTSNIQPLITLRLFAPVHEIRPLPGSPGEGRGREGSPSMIGSPLIPAPAGPSPPLSYPSFQPAHLHFAILAREVYTLASAVKSRRGDSKFWGPHLGSSTSAPSHLQPSPLAPIPPLSPGSPAPDTSAAPKLSSEAVLQQHSALKGRLWEMYRAFTPFVSGPLAPPPGTKPWASVRLDLLHMRCCAIHLETLMFCRGAGNIEQPSKAEMSIPSKETEASSIPSPPSNNATPEAEPECKSEAELREKVIEDLQPDFAYLITLAEELRAATARSNDAPAAVRIPDSPAPPAASRYLVPSPSPIPRSPAGLRHPQFSNSSIPSPSLSPNPQAQLSPSPSPRVPTTSSTILPTLQPQPQAIAIQPAPIISTSASRDPDTGQFATDLGVVSPMYLAAVHIRDRWLRRRALAVMRAAKGPMEGFWDGGLLADLLEKIFVAMDEVGDEGGGEMGMGDDDREATGGAWRGEGKGRSGLEKMGLTISGGTSIPDLFEKLEGFRI